MSDVISKSQIDDRIKTDTGYNIASLLYTLGIDNNNVFFIIFDKIRSNADTDALNFLMTLPDVLKHQTGVFFIFSSSVNLSKLSQLHVKLTELSLHEISIVLSNKFGNDRFSSNEIALIHEKSEGVISKLEQIIFYLEDSSANEVLQQHDIFDSSYHSDSIPQTTLKQIELLRNNPEKHLTFTMLKLLTILKNGESLSNLRKHKMGIDLSPKNTKELKHLELATSIYIDNVTTIIKINPIIKDYLISLMSEQEIREIAKAYLSLTIVEGKDGIRINSVNRKIYEHGYGSEEDNSNNLLKLSFEECVEKLQSVTESTPKNEIDYFKRRLNKLLYLSHAYVYSLCNSSRFNEAIYAIKSLIFITKDLDPNNLYKYYLKIAYSYRMISNLDEAQRFIFLCKKGCPEEDKLSLSKIYMEELHILKSLDPDGALRQARANRKNFKANSPAHIMSDYIIFSYKDNVQSSLELLKLEKKARRLNYHTLANNILLSVSTNNTKADLISATDMVIKTDTSAYNICRATVYKYEHLVNNGKFNQISDKNFEHLMNVYNYLFRQRFDVLFEKCHELLWHIAENKNNKDIIVFIFYKGGIIWKLNHDQEMETKYRDLIVNILPEDNQLSFERDYGISKNQEIKIDE